MTEPMFETKLEKTGDHQAKFVISPLEQGYGNTLGNSLRRVLLKSLGGYAITSVKISGVKHQYSTLKGMKEDVIELILNLKKVRFIYSLTSGDKEKAKLSVKGPGEVKAKDIKVTGSLGIANPEHVLTYLNKGAKLDVEMVVCRGTGYQSADEQEGGKIGVIPVDAIFSPVVRVNYKVEETRVGRLTNFDKLTLEILTDGTIDPKEALVRASKILVDYFNQIINPKKVEKKEIKEKDLLGPVGKLSVEEIGLPTRVANALIKAGYETVEDLASAKREDLVKVRNLGEKSIKIVTLAMAEKGVEMPGS